MACLKESLQTLLDTERKESENKGFTLNSKKIETMSRKKSPSKSNEVHGTNLKHTFEILGHVDDIRWKIYFTD